MKQLLVILILSAGLIGCGQNQPIDDSERLKLEAEVQSAFKSLYSAAKNLDADAYFSHFDKDKFTGLNADGTVWHDIESLEKIIRPGFNWVTRVDSLTFNNVKITLIDRKTAILVNEYEQHMTLKKGNPLFDAGGGTQVWSKHSGKWLLVSVSASSKAPAK